MPSSDTMGESDTMVVFTHVSAGRELISYPGLNIIGGMQPRGPNLIDSPTMGESMRLGPRGCMPPMMFRPGYDINSLPAETCGHIESVCGIDMH
jgi:hypothetical protein